MKNKKTSNPGGAGEPKKPTANEKSGNMVKGERNEGNGPEGGQTGSQSAQGGKKGGNRPSGK